MDKKENKWFASWFDSPYYHILYKDRDYNEAEYFLKNLTDYLMPSSEHQILDLACGAGRHSIFLNSLGYKVTGLDLSANSINTANESSNTNLSFIKHDMREVYKQNEFDFVLNLFTSFGYFESENDNVKMINSVEISLKKDGIFVLDFFNAKKVIANLESDEIKTVDGIEFHLKRELKNGIILKHIDFEADGEKFSFTEKVEAITLNNFKELFSQSNLNIIATFGNYSLDEFDENNSDRTIIVAKKLNE